MKIKVIGNVVVFMSAIKMEDLEKVKKSAPDKMKLRDDKGNELFALDVVAAGGGVGKYGISYDAKNTEGYAITSVAYAGEISDVKAWVVSEYSSVISMAEKIESALPNVVDEINATNRRIMDSITVM